MQRKIVKWLQRHLHSLCRPFSSFQNHLLSQRMWGAMVEQKLATMKTKTMNEIGVKMEESSKEVKDTLASILGLLQNKN